MIIFVRNFLQDGFKGLVFGGMFPECVCGAVIGFTEGYDRSLVKWAS